jgi:Domain of unknown function (DUF2703)
MPPTRRYSKPWVNSRRRSDLWVSSQSLQSKEIDQEAFQANPSESNRIWIRDRPFEEWLGAKVASSRCSSVCGDSQCHTVEIEDTIFEAIPQELLIKAALMAAS